jgi:hypothetical protein
MQDGQMRIGFLRERSAIVSAASDDSEKSTAHRMCLNGSAD